MTVDIYPAILIGNEIEHADSWNEDSTVNIANGNFYTLADDLNLSNLMLNPGFIRVKTLRIALATSGKTRYHDRLSKICAIAEIRKAPFIAFS